MTRPPGCVGFYRFLRTLGLDPGAEFKVVMEEARRVGARVVYGDRRADITMQVGWRPTWWCAGQRLVINRLDMFVMRRSTLV